MLNLKVYSDKPTVHEFRPRLRPALRAPQGVRNSTLAAVMGVGSASTIKAWRAGEREPQRRNRERLEHLQRLIHEIGG